MKKAIVGFGVGFVVGYTGLIFTVGLDRIDEDTKVIALIVGLITGGFGAIIFRNSTKD